MCGFKTGKVLHGQNVLGNFALGSLNGTESSLYSKEERLKLNVSKFVMTSANRNEENKNANTKLKRKIQGIISNVNR